MKESREVLRGEKQRIERGVNFGELSESGV